MLNKEISLTGNIGKIDAKFSPAGKFIFEFSLAVKGYGGKPDEWFDCVAWEKNGETLNEYAGVGSKIQIRGDFKLETWSSKDSGEARGKIVVTVREFQFLSNKKKDSDNPYDEAAHGVGDGEDAPF